MGKDKYENEELIRCGFEEDIWFHVDDLSSAHVYLRLPLGNSKLTSISPTCLEECAQLVKENSIEGKKRKSVEVIYTRWKNLKKTPGMEVGAVVFHRPENIKRTSVRERNAAMVKQLNKTKVEKYPDLDAARHAQERLYKAERKRQAQRLERERKEEKQRYQEQVKLRSYEYVRIVR